VVRQFLIALSFLTIFRVGGKKADVPPKENLFARSAAFFPLVGFFLGLLLAAVDGIASFLFPVSVSSAMVLIAGAFFTAGLHLDGFADTVDGLGAFLKGGRERALEVMKDSRSGALGVLGLVLLSLLKYALLVSLAGTPRFLVLFLMPAAGRWLQVAAGKLYPYARSTPGLGRGFAGQMTTREIFLSLAWLLAGAAAGVAFLGGGGRPELLTAALAGLVSAVAGGLLFSLVLARCFGGMTGDTLGAVSEAGEVFFLLGAAAALGAAA
jgi:adenosylcobinamide-GDP ribazoletransferase